jgi:hypothetical protein
MRLLDVGCGWGGMVRHAAKNYGVQVMGVTLSRAQATWAQERIKSEGLDDLAEVRHQDYRDVVERDFDAVSSIGLIEHIGVKNYPAYFGFLRSRLRPEGRLLNHGITRSDNKHPGLPRRGFIGRYVFPDGELTGSGDIVRAVEDAGLEVQHQENLRVHYAKTLHAWCDNLVANWDACVADASLPDRQGVGPLHGRLGARASSATASSCTRCWRRVRRTAARPATRCVTTSASEALLALSLPDISPAGWALLVVAAVAVGFAKTASVVSARSRPPCSRSCCRPASRPVHCCRFSSPVTWSPSRSTGGTPRGD